MKNYQDNSQNYNISRSKYHNNDRNSIEKDYRKSDYERGKDYKPRDRLTSSDSSYSFKDSYDRRSPKNYKKSYYRGSDDQDNSNGRKPNNFKYSRNSDTSYKHHYYERGNRDNRDYRMSSSPRREREGHEHDYGSSHSSNKYNNNQDKYYFSKSSYQESKRRERNSEDKYYDYNKKYERKEGNNYSSRFEYDNRYNSNKRVYEKDYRSYKDNFSPNYQERRDRDKDFERGGYNNESSYRSYQKSYGNSKYSNSSYLSERDKDKRSSSTKYYENFQSNNDEFSVSQQTHQVSKYTKLNEAYDYPREDVEMSSVPYGSYGHVEQFNPNYALATTELKQFSVEKPSVMMDIIEEESTMINEQEKDLTPTQKEPKDEDIFNYKIDFIQINTNSTNLNKKLQNQFIPLFIYNHLPEYQYIINKIVDGVQNDYNNKQIEEQFNKTFQNFDNQMNDDVIVSDDAVKSKQYSATFVKEDDYLSPNLKKAINRLKILKQDQIRKEIKSISNLEELWNNFQLITKQNELKIEKQFLAYNEFHK